MYNPRELDERHTSSQYVEQAVDPRPVFVPNTHVRGIGVSERAEAIRETYRLLAIAVFAAMASGWMCSRNLEVIRFMAGPMGWILAMVGLNVIPTMLMGAARRSSKNAALLLAGHGAFAGVALSPLVFVALVKSGLGSDAPNLVQSALVITAAVFLGISGYVYQSGAQFNMLKGMGSGMAWALLAIIPIQAFWIQNATLSLVIFGAIGILGSLQLLWATSTVLRDPEFNEPAYGALALFAGLFNLFQSILALLTSRK